MRDVLRAGADKVSLNTAAVADPTLISRCAAGSGARRSSSPSTRWPSRRAPRPRRIRRRRVAPGGADPTTPSWEVVVKGGREPTGLDVVAWAERAVELGAGELLVTSIDRDGTGSGFDTDLLRAITSSGRRAGHRVGWRGRTRRLRRARSATAAPTPSSPPRSSTAGSTPSPTSRRRWPRPACRSGSCRRPSHDAGRAAVPSRQLRPGRARAGRRPGRRRRARADGGLHGRRGAGRDDRDRRGPLPLALTRPAVAQGRDERQRPAPGRTSRPIATATRCSSRSIRPGRPATAARAAASTPTARPPTERARGSPGSRRCGRRSPSAPRGGRPARTRCRCSTAASMPPAAR